MSNGPDWTCTNGSRRTSWFRIPKDGSISTIQPMTTDKLGRKKASQNRNSSVFLAGMSLRPRTQATRIAVGQLKMLIARYSPTEFQIAVHSRPSPMARAQ
jgi:hypothetical protein